MDTEEVARLRLEKSLTLHRAKIEVLRQLESKLDARITRLSELSTAAKTLIESMMTNPFQLEVLGCWGGKWWKDLADPSHGFTHWMMMAAVGLGCLLAVKLIGPNRFAGTRSTEMIAIEGCSWFGIQSKFLWYGKWRK